MLGKSLQLLVGVCVWGLASCDKCPDGSSCSAVQTCCLGKHGYSCCGYPNAVCCSDLTHCCPQGYDCNTATQMCEKGNEPWISIPMAKKEEAKKPALQEPENKQVPDQPKSSVVYCDSYTYCPDGTTCCRHPTGVWFCCPFSPGRCCLDGYHCCPFGFDCDLTYTRCVRRGLIYPFTPTQPLFSVLATHISTSEDKNSLQETPMTALTEASSGNHENGVIRCDSRFYCSQGTTCCKGTGGQWNCCPYPLGQCCADGQHCCQYGYTCATASMSCRRGLYQIPSGAQEPAKSD